MAKLTCDLTLGPVSITSVSISCEGDTYAPGPVQVTGTYSGDDSVTAISITSTTAEVRLSDIAITSSYPISAESSTAAFHLSSANQVGATAFSEAAIACISDSNLSFDVTDSDAGLDLQVAGVAVGIGAPDGTTCQSVLLRNGTYTVAANAFPQ
jgi:hypothetical protein